MVPNSQVISSNVNLHPIMKDILWKMLVFFKEPSGILLFSRGNTSKTVFLVTF